MATEGDILWQASPELGEWLRLTTYRHWLETNDQLRFDDYQALWRWSVDQLETFRETVWRFKKLLLGGGDRSLPRLCGGWPPGSA
jgi:hypothetical protein